MPVVHEGLRLRFSSESPKKTEQLPGRNPGILGGGGGDPPPDLGGLGAALKLKK